MLDAVILGGGVVLGRLAAGELLIGVALQTLVPIVAVPLVLFRAGQVASGRDGTDAETPFVLNGAPLRGRTAVVAGGALFLVHYGLFASILTVMLVTFAFQVGLGPSPLLAVFVLGLRAVLAGVVTAREDLAFLTADGAADLGAKTSHLMGRPYRRILPLHVGLVGLVVAMAAVPGGVPGWARELAIVVLVVVTTYLAASWRYPALPGSASPAA